MSDIPLEKFNLGLTGRFNYYYPLSHTKIYGIGTPYASYALSDSGIVLYGGRVEEPMRGFDYEAGVRIPYISKYVETWAYAGGYHYKGRRVRDINGFQTRLEIIPTDFMRLNYEFHHDNYSKAEHYGEVTFEVPFSIGNLVTGKNPFEGIGDVFTGSRELTARMVEPTRRDVDVKVIVDNENGNIPGGGEEIEDIVFVSETGSDVTGDGTIDNPYATISYALASDPRIISGACRTIHVMNSSTTTVISDSPNMNIASFLLWGSGVNHPKYPVSNMPYSGHPTIDDTVVIRAPGMTVTGLHFDTTTTNNHGINIIDTAAGAGPIITNNLFDIAIDADWEAGINCWINTGMGDLGTLANPAVIANNIINLTDTGANIGVGIGLAADNIYARIINNTITTTSGGSDTYGIRIVQPSALAGAGTLGSADSPIIVAGNDVTITSSGGAQGLVFGVNGNGSSTFTNILGNSFDVTGPGDSYGIRFYDSADSFIGSESNPVIISGNRMTVTSTGDNAYGIRLDADEYIFAKIVGNDMSNTITANDNAYGIRLNSAGGSIGSETRPVIVSGNPLAVTSFSFTAIGIMFNSNNDIFAAITGNNMSNSITGNDAGIGVYLNSAGGSIGSETRPVIVSGNPLAVTSFSSTAIGIMFQSNNDIFAAITGNNMSNSIEGSLNTFGIYLNSSNSAIGSAASPVIISGNLMRVIGNNDNAFGIYINADAGIFANIKSNYMNITSGTDNAYGAQLFAGGIIGDVTSLATYFIDNSGTISGVTGRYALYLNAGTPGGGNFVNWAGSSFTPVGGAWSGNYGPLNQILHNFTLPPDVITP